KDGKEAYLAYDNGAVEVWALPGAKRRALEPVLPRSVLCLAMSGDGHTLAACAEDGTLQVWDLRQPGRRPLVFKQHGAGLEKPAVALDYLGTLLASSAPVEGGGKAQVATVWELATGTPVAAPIEVDESISILALHREKELIAIGMHSGTVHVGNYRTEQEVLPALTHPSTVTSLTINADATTLTVGDGHGYLYAWDLSNGQPRVPAQHHDGEIVVAQQSLEQDLIASVSRHGELQVWNTVTGMRVQQRLQHSVADVSITPDCSMLALAPRHEPHVQIWSIHDRMATRRFVAGPKATLAAVPEFPVNTPADLHNAQVLGWNPVAGQAATADDQGDVRIFDFRTGADVGMPLHHPPAVGAIALSQDGRLAVTSGRDQEVRLWDIETGRSTGISLRHHSFVGALALSADAKRLVTVTDEGEIRVWETATGNCLTPGIREGGAVTHVSVAPDGAQLIYRAAGEGWFALPMPPQSVFLPDWFLDLAEALARRRLSTEGKAETLTLADFQRISRQVPKVVAETELTAARWAQWLLADPEQRPLSPLETDPFATYLESLLQTTTPAAAAEVLRYRPHDPEAERKSQGAE
ncbi:MAG: WD40 repeat domain-containing protein, partial [Prosthecobacter sp.]|nr:WD40 repeat domain-containing protein [Prosthecobacter sp.]